MVDAWQFFLLGECDQISNRRVNMRPVNEDSRSRLYKSLRYMFQGDGGLITIRRKTS